MMASSNVQDDVDVVSGLVGVDLHVAVRDGLDLGALLVLFQVERLALAARQETNKDEMK